MTLTYILTGRSQFPLAGLHFLDGVPKSVSVDANTSRDAHSALSTSSHIVIGVTGPLPTHFLRAQARATAHGITVST